MQQAKGNGKYDFMEKVIIIGDSGVGKTNLITRFCENNFKESYVATIGVDFKIKTMNMGNRKYKLQIWDTAGQERFKNITQTYYKGAAGIILTYSITDKASFQNIERWMQQIDNNAPTDVSKVLLATKADLTEERQVSTDQGIGLGLKFGIGFLQVSGRSGVNVKEGFELLVGAIHKNYLSRGEFQGVSTRKQILVGQKQGEPPRKGCGC